MLCRCGRAAVLDSGFSQSRQSADICAQGLSLACALSTLPCAHNSILIVWDFVPSSSLVRRPSAGYVHLTFPCIECMSGCSFRGEHCALRRSPPAYLPAARQAIATIALVMWPVILTSALPERLTPHLIPPPQSHALPPGSGRLASRPHSLHRSRSKS
ncbi:hypothetical protein OH76DRAFT_944024 [Lentinus brumalis]|uniref:Uncharacterized protein n=1 Tax=Lentinus brumalis TaxID=2498619 RepID=A0A371CZ25_9APHY|nr:hypothetical protein OH76DRAFT_944024 [Polyporus brumalis]